MKRVFYQQQHVNAFMYRRYIKHRTIERYFKERFHRGCFRFGNHDLDVSEVTNSRSLTGSLQLFSRVCGDPYYYMYYECLLARHENALDGYITEINVYHTMIVKYGIY